MFVGSKKARRKSLPALAGNGRANPGKLAFGGLNVLTQIRFVASHQVDLPNGRLLTMRPLFVVGLAAMLAACNLAPHYQSPAPAVSAKWIAPAPHSGDLAQLREWWSRFDDPLLVRLIDRAQGDNPSVVAAFQRIENARANLRATGASDLPTLNLNASGQRTASGVPPFATPRTFGGVTLDAAWELDLFGSVRNTREAARARVQAREAEWHDGRTSLAAEIANTYVSYRTCEALEAVQGADVESRRQTADLTQQKVSSGFTAPADMALLRASLTDARNRLVGQRADCDVLVKALVYLSGDDEVALRRALAERRAQLPGAVALTVVEVPAEVLAQRPDLAAAERELAAASAEAGVAEANRYPRISLTGTIGRQYFRFLGNSNIGNSWGFGPALTLPIFDAGRRTAQADAARARFAELRATYMQRAGSAVREVEEALVRLDSAARREADAQAAVRDFEIFLAAAQSRWKVGVGNLLELEEARRQALNANSVLLQIRRERVAQWINLYKALGGGWNDRAVVTAPPQQ